jgi:hypothetical protein
MSQAHDRRAPGTVRIPFDAMVEVGGALGPSFEAQAVNLSEEGMSLRTAYLPEVGQPVMCRFESGASGTVVAAGEVLWKDDMGEGGEFGIRFTNLDTASTASLQRVLGIGGPAEVEHDPGRKVRLHIEGLASPMRARIRDQAASGVTAYSELGFLQMGKPLELEDAASGNRRPALIDRVEVAVDDASRIPQLVVSLRYDDTDGRAAVTASDDTDIPVEPPAEIAEEAPAAEAAAVAVAGEEAAESEEETAAGPAERFKTAMSKGAAKLGPTLKGWATRAKVAAALVAARARREGTGDDVEIPVRRTTAPAPGGGLHAAGRKVVRGSVPDTERFEGEPAPSRFSLTKKKAAVGGTIGIAVLLAFLAMRKPAAPVAVTVPSADPSAAPAPAPEAPAIPAATAKAPVAPPTDPLAAAAAAPAPTGKPGKPVPFTNGPVGSHANVIKIKMDGAIEGIQGATQPTGFTIVTPNRKVADPSISLADKDPRLAGVRVSNETGSAEFTVTFKDGVPNYVVRAHNDTLELVLAHAGTHEKAEANASSGKKKRHKR